MKSLSYSDVYLVPKYSELHSRGHADISVEFLNRKFRAPWIPANMSSVIDQNIATYLAMWDYFYIMHRFDNTLKFVESMQHTKLISISVGVKEEDKELLRNIAQKNLIVDYITIDIAHGDSILMKEMIDFIKNLEFKSCLSPFYIDSQIPGRLLTSVPLRYYPKIIAGNVCTYDAIQRLESWGADAAKVGIAGGGACSTKNQTGFHIPMFSCIKRCNWRLHKIPIIADGGIREPGDISKALVAGATMVMAGSMFAACIDSPAENISIKVETEKSKTQSKKFYEWYDKLPMGHCLDVTLPKKEYEDFIIKKRYHGSASEKQKGEKKHVEGFELEIPCNGLTYEQKYKELEESLSSAVSYAGGKNLLAFKSVNYVEI